MPSLYRRGLETYLKCSQRDQKTPGGTKVFFVTSTVKGGKVNPPVVGLTLITLMTVRPGNLPRQAPNHRPWLPKWSSDNCPQIAAMHTAA